MKKIISFLVFISAFVAFTNAQTTYNVFTYKKPIGYKEEKKQGFVTYSKTDTKKGTYCIIALYDQTKASPTLDESFNNNWQELVAHPYSVTAAPEAQNLQDQNGWKVKSGGAAFQFNGGNSLAFLTTFQQDTADANIQVLTNTQDFLPDYNKFLASLKLSKPIADKLSPANTPIVKTPTSNNTNTKNNNLVGVWVGLASNLTLDRIKWKWKIFFNDGTALQIIPDEGLYNFSMTEQYKTYLANYTINGNIGILKSGDQNQFTDKIELKTNGTAIIDGYEYQKCQLLDGKKLNGTYSYYTKNDPIQKTLQAGAKPQITFTTNGEFVDEGLFVNFISDYSDSEENKKAGKGTYEIKNFSIILKYTDGRVKQQALTIPYGATAEKNEKILLNRLSLEKIK